MALNNFRLNVVLRTLALVCLLTAFIYSLFRPHWVITPFILLVFVIIAVMEMIFYVEKTNREFTNFLLSIKSSDFAKYSQSDKRGKSFTEFKQALNIIIEEFQLARIDKESNYVFLQKVVEHMNTAIIAFDSNGEVKLINDAAKNLLRLSYLKNVYSLQQTDPELCRYLVEDSNMANPIRELTVHGQQLKLSVRSTNFSLQGIQHKLISIQNIKTELEQTEIEAWEQLLRVLTHEIMNSMTPVSSLSATLKTKADHLMHATELDPKEMDDLSQGLNVIAKRSIGLVNFVNNYKSLITLPQPDLKPVNILELFERVRKLKETELQQKNIALKVNVTHKDLTAVLDASLAEQILINLVNNAIDATEQHETPEIELSASNVDDAIMLQVSDNGPGIEADHLDKIFIPFFSTKNRGSGIGLSLSKQIMRLHGGSINVTSVPGKGSSFQLLFP